MEEVPHHFFLPVPVEVALMGVGIVMVVLREEAADDGVGLHAVARRYGHLHAIAGGKDQRFLDPVTMDQSV